MDKSTQGFVKYRLTDGKELMHDALTTGPGPDLQITCLIRTRDYARPMNPTFQFV